MVHTSRIKRAAVPVHGRSQSRARVIARAVRAAPTVPVLAPAVVIAAVIVMAPKLMGRVHIRLGRTAGACIVVRVRQIII